MLRVRVMVMAHHTRSGNLDILILHLIEIRNEPGILMKELDDPLGRIPIDEMRAGSIISRESMLRKGYQSVSFPSSISRLGRSSQPEPNREETGRTWKL